MKRAIPILLAILLTLCALPAAASPAGDREPLIADDADLFTDREEALLRESMLSLCEFGTPMLWTTDRSSDFGLQASAEKKAQDFFLAHQGHDDGVLFVIDMQNREICIHVEGKVSRTVTNSVIRSVVDNVYRDAGRGDYYACASSAFFQVLTRLQGRRIAEPMRLITAALAALALAMMIIYGIAALRHRSPVRIRRGKVLATLPGGLLTSDHQRVDFKVRKRTLLSQQVYYPVERSDSDSGSWGSSSSDSSRSSGGWSGGSSRSSGSSWGGSSWGGSSSSSRSGSSGSHRF